MKLLIFRTLAFLVDSIFLLLITIIGIVTSGYFGFLWHFTDTIILLSFAIGYFGTYEGLNRATLGRRLFKLVVKINNGNKLTLFDGYLRATLFFGGYYLISFIFDFLSAFILQDSIFTKYFYEGYSYIIPSIFVWSIFLGKGGAGLHDALANTIVCFIDGNTFSYKPSYIVFFTFILSIFFTTAIGSVVYLSGESKNNLYSNIELSAKYDAFYGHKGVLRYILNNAPGVYDVQSSFVYKYNFSDLTSPNNHINNYNNESELKLTLNINLKVSSYMHLSEDTIRNLFNLIADAVNDKSLSSSIDVVNLNLTVARTFGSLYGRYGYSTTGMWNSYLNTYDIVTNDEGKSVQKTAEFGFFMGPYFGQLMHPDINEEY
ncbi:MAG: RDD family protein [Candidatus Thiodiazotropha endolucinida]|nr:RDD family protein [Candidatus Thiodiazotropha taylori]MCW4316481.1 RDD family protein [Candidatus Thiodiazotropha taylori]